MTREEFICFGRKKFVPGAATYGKARQILLSGCHWCTQEIRVNGVSDDLASNIEQALQHADITVPGDTYPWTKYAMMHNYDPAQTG